MFHLLQTALMATAILIFLHFIYNHLKNTLTVPLVKLRNDRKHAEIDALLT
jgi:hypothetical protein